MNEGIKAIIRAEQNKRPNHPNKKYYTLEEMRMGERIAYLKQRMKFHHRRYQEIDHQVIILKHKLTEMQDRRKP